MDGVSTAISLFSSGYTAFKKVREVRKAIKDAPGQLDSLERSCALIEHLLNNLKAVSSCLPAHNDLHHLDHLSEQAQHHFEEVQKIANKVTKGHSNEDRSTGERKIRPFRWILHKESIERMEAEMKELQNMLGILLVSVQQPCFTSLLTKVNNVENALTIRSHRGLLFKDAHEHGNRSAEIDTYTGEPDEGDDATRQIVRRARSSDPLRCPPRCECRCHYPATIRLLPPWLASYTGQISMSKRLLHSPPPCNVQTCRGDAQRAFMVQWILPAGFLQGCLQSSKYPGRIHFLIGAPRIIPFNAPIHYAIRRGKFECVRGLFVTGQASIWDYTLVGMPIFWDACRVWQRDPNNEDRLKIIRLFIEAGADMLLFEEVQLCGSAHDLLAVGFFKHLLDGNSDGDRSLAAIVRTNPAAISIFLSFLNVDPMDALEDFMTRKRAQYTDIAGCLAALEDIGCNRDSANRLSVITEVTGHTRLKYAIIFSPDSMWSFLSEGEDAAKEPALIYAISHGMSHLIKPLLDAGANVNMRDWQGYTALHSACSQCYPDCFFELLRWAEDDIDWNACTLEEQNALELFDLRVSTGWAATLSQSEIDEFRTELAARIDTVAYDSDDGQLDMPGAFPDAL